MEGVIKECSPPGKLAHADTVENILVMNDICIHSEPNSCEVQQQKQTRKATCNSVTADGTATQSCADRQLNYITNFFKRKSCCQ